jgi:hypothetical protein
MSDFPIEHNVPIAVPRYLKYPFRDMNVGDSLVCDGDPGNLRSAAVKAKDEEIADLKEAALLTKIFGSEKQKAEDDARDLTACRAQLALLKGRLDGVRLAVDGYIDGAPDCNAVSKLANEVSLIIDPT